MGQWRNEFHDNYLGSPNGGGSTAVDVRGAFRNIRDRDAALNFRELRRPYFDDHDRPCVVVNTGRWTVNKGEKQFIYEKKYIHDLSRKGWGLPPVVNATTLRKEEWLELDRVVLRAARYRLRAWADLAAANSYGGFNGMAKTTLEYEQMSDPGEAVVDMTGLTPGRFDAPLFQLQGLPLPITHSDFWFSSRELAESRNSGTPLSTTMGEACGRRVAEAIEKTTIGVQTGVTGATNTLTGGYGLTPKVYGYTNFTPRLTYTTLNTPTGSNPDATLQDVLNMRTLLLNGKFYGPYMIYHGPSWDAYMDNDYARAVVGTNSIATELTLRERLRKIEGIQDVRRLDMMFDQTPVAGSGSYGALEYDTILLQYTLIMVQMTPDVAQAVNGLDITTLQWETVGGLQVNFKCFGGETQFITKKGNKTLREMAGQKVEVLNRFGKWEMAEVKSFGTQKLMRIGFEHLNPVYATAEHQWWMRDGKRVSTMELTKVPFTDESLGHAKVTSVVNSDRTEEVFCCVCPESQSFTLANGLTTSNCLAIQVPRLRCDYYSNAGLLEATTH